MDDLLIELAARAMWRADGGGDAEDDWKRFYQRADYFKLAAAAVRTVKDYETSRS